VLELEGVSRTFPSGKSVLEVLTAVNLSIGPGDRIAVIGPSGSGKSTLLHILGLLLPPSAGAVRVGGQEAWALKADDRSEIRRTTIGFVFQAFHLVPTLTAEENVRLARTFGPRREDLPAIQGLMMKVGLANRAHHRPRELSGGEQQRVALARALANRPQVLLADEPTGNLDTAMGKDVAELLWGLADEGVAVIVATHDVGVAREADIHMGLVDGRLIPDPG
jgi:ABC-type lipoprotein export system ATPase subunit